MPQGMQNSLRHPGDIASMLRFDDSHILWRPARLQMCILSPITPECG
jgi:hypothetical protein